MQDEAGRMQERVDELGEHADAAEKKAQLTREHSDLDAEEPVVADDPDDEASTDEDAEGAEDDGPEGAEDDGPGDRD